MDAFIWTDWHRYIVVTWRKLIINVTGHFHELVVSWRLKPLERWAGEVKATEEQWLCRLLVGIQHHRLSIKTTMHLNKSVTSKGSHVASSSSWMLGRKLEMSDQHGAVITHQYIATTIAVHMTMSHTDDSRSTCRRNSHSQRNDYCWLPSNDSNNIEIPPCAIIYCLWHFVFNILPFTAWKMSNNHGIKAIN